MSFSLPLHSWNTSLTVTLIITLLNFACTTTYGSSHTALSSITRMGAKPYRRMHLFDDFPNLIMNSYITS